jgi:subfamily B ATP-binding cassette protein MsbA
LKPYWGLIFLSAFLAIPLAALRVAPAPLVKYVVDDLLVNKDVHKLMIFPAAFVGIYIINFVVRFFHYYLLRIVVARVNQRLKNDLHGHLMGLSADYFTTQSTGTLMSRVAADPAYIDAGLGSINILIREPITFLFLLGYSLHLNWRLTAVAFLVFPAIIWVFRATGRNLKRYISRLTQESETVYSSLQESFTGIRTIKSFRLERYVRKKFRESNDRFTGLLLKTSALEEASHPLVELLSGIALAVVIYYGGTLVIAGKMTPGDLLAFFAAFMMMMNPLRLMNDVNIKLNSATAAANRVFDLFEWKSRLVEAENPVNIEAIQKEIRFENVHFAYPDAPQREVLGGLSFAIPKGSTVALVGASGAGKSSVASLLSRVYDVTAGSIRVDGYDLRELSLSDLRKMLAVVSQDVFLFNDTIEENIRCGRLDASPEEIRQAAQRAHALDFIEDLPDGFQTVIGDRGQKLSGGERQRLSIARAFLRGAPILILDEATSSLDTASERVVQEALDELMQNRTTLMIAHRLSTVKDADQIFVMKDGAIVESGRHDELLIRNGEYAKFHQLSAVGGMN